MPDRSPRIFSAADGVAAGAGDFILLVARVAMGCLFLAEGWLKLNNMSGTVAYLASLGAPSPGLASRAAMITELTCGLALIFGVATRYAALVIIGFTIVATYLAHRFWLYPQPRAGNEEVHFYKNIALIGGALALFWAGAGRFSLDAVLRRR